MGHTKREEGIYKEGERERECERKGEREREREREHKCKLLIDLCLKLKNLVLRQGWY